VRPLNCWPRVAPRGVPCVDQEHTGGQPDEVPVRCSLPSLAVFFAHASGLAHVSSAEHIDQGGFAPTPEEPSSTTVSPTTSDERSSLMPLEVGQSRMAGSSLLAK